jgi:beta-lactamase class A
MSIFRNKKEEDYDYEDEEFEEHEDRRPNPRKFKDLKPENKKKRKEPPKPWGRPERLTVLIVILITVLTSVILSLSARNFKLPGLPRISLPSFNWGEDIFYIEGDKGGREKAEKARNYFKDKTRNLSGLYAINVVRLLDGTSYGVNENEEMQAASLIKLPLMTLVYKKDEAGQLDLDEKVSGSNSTYRELVEAMGQRSDNVAQTTLVKTFGEEEVQKYIENIGMTKTSLDKNETTPEEIGLFFKMLWEGKLTTEKHKEELLGYMTDTIFEDWIIKGIGEVKVAHKYGREVHVVNDAGIVFAAKPFVLVLMSDGAIETEADSVIPAVAREIYEIEIGN